MSLHRDNGLSYVAIAGIRRPLVLRYCSLVHDGRSPPRVGCNYEMACQASAGTLCKHSESLDIGRPALASQRLTIARREPVLQTLFGLTVGRPQICLWLIVFKYWVTYSWKYVDRSIGSPIIVDFQPPGLALCKRRTASTYISTGLNAYHSSPSSLHEFVCRHESLLHKCCCKANSVIQ